MSSVAPEHMHSFVFQSRSLYIIVLLMDFTHSTVYKRIPVSLPGICRLSILINSLEIPIQEKSLISRIRVPTNCPQTCTLNVHLLILIMKMFTHFQSKETHLWQSNQLHQQVDHYSHVTQYKTHLRWPPLLQQHLSSQLWAASPSRHACTVYWWTSPQAACPTCCPFLHSLQYNMTDSKSNVCITGHG